MDSQNMVIRTDGYSNVVNKYGTSQDSSTAYRFQQEGLIPDIELTAHYEGNGLFAKIIDAPSEEAVKHGFDLGVKEQETTELVENYLDALNWEEAAATAIKWSRLYGGSIIVMIIDDGGTLEQPLNLANVRGVEELRVYERACVQPDYTAMLYGRPQYYQVNSIYGYFVVHESRCLVFKNGRVPERTHSMQYRFWGIPEYLRISRELRECSTSHGHGVKLLERSVQAVYKMQDLIQNLETEDGEEMVLKRLRAIDRARNILNSIAIDAGVEDYDFKTIPFGGVKDIIDTTCNMLSAVTNIPQAVLFGRSPAGMNATGQSDLENYYNLIRRIQSMMLRGNFIRLVDLIFRAALANGEIDEKPACKIKFKPLWSLNELERAQVDKTNADIAQVKAQTAQIYVDMQAVDPMEIRRGLADNNEFDIEKMLDDMPESDLMAAWEQSGENSPTDGEETPAFETDEDEGGTVGVIVFKNGKVLVGCRSDDGTIASPGGHIEDGETAAQAAVRETREEFGIRPTAMKYLGRLENLPEEYGRPHIYLCTAYKGYPKCESGEVLAHRWIAADGGDSELFPPFRAALELLPDAPKKELTSVAEGDIIDSGNKVNADAGDKDVKFVTINGAAVPIKDGELQGKVGKKIEDEGKKTKGKSEGASKGKKTEGGKQSKSISREAIAEMTESYQKANDKMHEAFKKLRDDPTNSELSKQAEQAMREVLTIESDARKAKRALNKERKELEGKIKESDKKLSEPKPAKEKAEEKKSELTREEGERKRPQSQQNQKGQEKEEHQTLEERSKREQEIIDENYKKWSEDFHKELEDVRAKNREKYPETSPAASEKGKITKPSKTITEVYDKKGGERLEVVPNSPVTNKYTIAGTKGKAPLKQEARLIKEYGGKQGLWQKATQYMKVKVGGIVKTAEVHYFYEKSVGYVEQKINRFVNAVDAFKNAWKGE